MSLRALPALVASLMPGVALAETDYFGRPELAPGAAPVAPPAVNLTLPEPLRALLSAALDLQRGLDATLRQQLDAASHGAGFWAAAAAIVAASFLYGMLHAIGPGHGKVVVASYLSTRRARFASALKMSGTVAAAQALSAILLVGVLALVFGTTGKAILSEAARIEFASYVAIAGLGLWMAWGALRPQTACGCGLAHGHHADHPGHGAHGHHHGHAHGDHGHVHDAQDRPRDWLPAGVLAGLRPCSGAILVLLFTLANGILAVGIASTLAMGAGVALTVAAVSVGALGVNRAAAAGGARLAAPWLGRAASLAGALAIATFGAAAASAIALGLVSPLAG